MAVLRSSPTPPTTTDTTLKSPTRAKLNTPKSTNLPTKLLTPKLPTQHQLTPRLPTQHQPTLKLPTLNQLIPRLPTPSHLILKPPKSQQSTWLSLPSRF